MSAGQFVGLVELQPENDCSLKKLLAREKLNWEPKIPLKDGLKRTIAYFDDLLRKISDGRKD